jgi:putative oxidoreductase
MDLLISLNNLNLLSGVSDLGLLIVRVLFAIMFFYYGWPKLKDLKANAEDFEKMGFKPGWLFGTPIAFLETGGSLLILFGLFFGFIPLLFALHMITGTIWKYTSTDKPFTDWSYDLLLLSISILFMITGPGSLQLLALLGS